MIDIDNKSITHRPDLWGHHGMAREVAAITGKTCAIPVKLEPLPNAWQPDQDRNRRPHPLPALQRAGLRKRHRPALAALAAGRLTAIGLNPINNIVDLTNYLMAELAQPMHAFDREKLHGDTICARPAREGETYRCAQR